MMLRSAKTRSLVVVAPDFVREKVERVLHSADETRGLLSSGTIAFLSEASDDEADVIVAPALETVMHWAAHQNFHWATALGTASRVLSGLADNAANGNPLVVYDKDFDLRPERIRKAVLGKLETLQGLERELAPPIFHKPPLPTFLRGDISPLRMFSTLPVPTGEYSYWPFFQFFVNEGTCPASIDLMGYDRALVFGPYFVLPKGVWQAHVSFVLDRAATGYDYAVEFGSEASMSRVHFRAEKPGQQAVAVIFETRDYSPIEIRVRLLRAAFHGEFQFQGAFVTKISGDAATRA